MKGFTLIEAIITIFIFSLLIGVVAASVVTLYETKSYIFQQSIAISEARKGIEEMVKEIREATVGEDGSFPIEIGKDFEIVFYSDIDKDEEVEKIRYFLVSEGGKIKTQTKECVSFVRGGSCSVSFSDFAQGTIDKAEIKVSVEGDLNSSNETINIYGEGNFLGTLCQNGECGQCPGVYQDLTSFDVTDLVEDNSLEILASASFRVDPICDWIEENHSFKLKVELKWEEKGPQEEKALLKKGVINPTGFPPEYLSENEEIFTLSENIMNKIRGEPIFSYYDNENNLLTLPVNLKKVSSVGIKLIVNVDPDRPPQDFILLSEVQIRNLKSTP